MTYSIIGRDPVTGELGLAVQSRFFGAGRIVPWVKPGVGAIASQAFASPLYGREGLALLEQGWAPADVLERLKGEDEGAALRQVSILDAQGLCAVFTGSGCVAAAGHGVGANCVAQANMMLRDTVWAAMVRAFEQTGGLLADRLLAALIAAEREGGDIRGAQAAALIVVGAKASGDNQSDRVVDLRIDDHPDPIEEIGRLLAYGRAHQCAIAAIIRMQSGDPAGALGDLESSLNAFPADPEFLGRYAMVLMALGRFSEARAAVAGACASAPNTAEYLMRLADAGIIPVAREMLAPLMPSGG